MEPLILAAGLLIVLVVSIDALWTTLWVDGGASPIARPIMKGIRAMLEKMLGRSSSYLRSVAGPSILIGTAIAWVLMLWAGWTVAFLAEPTSVVDTQTGRPQGFWGTVYFVGFTIVTLGVGDVSPNGPFWQFLTVIASGSGIFLITLTITYLVSILGAQVEERSLADLVLGITPDPVTLVRSLRGDGTWPAFDGFALDAAERIGRTSERHLAYPALHFLTSGSRRKSPSVAVAVLDEALSIILLGFEDERPTGLPVDMLRAAVDNYLETIGSVRLKEAPDAPRVPSLVDLDLPGVVSQETFEKRMDEQAERRRKLLALVTAEGWEWE